MADLGNFDATTVDPRSTFEPIPNGTYPVLITASEMKPTKAGDGKYLELTLEIIDGEYKGRRLWDRLNLQNPNQQAVEIAQKTLSSICHATGVMKVSSSEQLHDKPMLAKVKVSKDGENNEIKGYTGMDGAAPITSAPSAKPAARAAAAPPWAAKKTA